MWIFFFSLRQNKLKKKIISRVIKGILLIYLMSSVSIYSKSIAWGAGSKLLTADCLSAHPLFCYQLIGDVSVVLPGHSLPDGRLHQTWQWRQHVDGRVNLEHKRDTNCVRMMMTTTQSHVSEENSHGFFGIDRCIHTASYVFTEQFIPCCLAILNLNEKFATTFLIKDNCLYSTRAGIRNRCMNWWLF